MNNHGGISVSEFDEMAVANPDDFALLDVRSEKEFAKKHIPGAQNMPFDDMLNNLERLRYLKDKQIVLYCNGGGKSKRAQKLMTEQGFEHALYLIGGFKAWNNS